VATMRNEGATADRTTISCGRNHGHLGHVFWLTSPRFIFASACRRMASSFSRCVLGNGESLCAAVERSVVWLGCSRDLRRRLLKPRLAMPLPSLRPERSRMLMIMSLVVGTLCLILSRSLFHGLRQRRVEQAQLGIGLTGGLWWGCQLW